jgi:hypothetical protein
VDCIVWDKQEQCMIAIEFKTGMEVNLNLGSGHNMSYPFEDKSDALWHHGLIQATVGDLAYRAEFGKMYKIGIPRVIRCTSYGLVHYKQPKWIKDNEEKLLQALKGHELVADIQQTTTTTKKNKRKITTIKYKPRKKTKT